MQEEPVSARLDMMIPPRASGGPEFILQEAEGPSIPEEDGIRKPFCNS
jgi:hypothetical protein